MDSSSTTYSSSTSFQACVPFSLRAAACVIYVDLWTDCSVGLSVDKKIPNRSAKSGAFRRAER